MPRRDYTWAYMPRQDYAWAYMPPVKSTSKMFLLAAPGSAPMPPMGGPALKMLGLASTRPSRVWILPILPCSASIFPVRRPMVACTCSTSCSVLADKSTPPPPPPPQQHYYQPQAHGQHYLPPHSQPPMPYPTAVTNRSPYAAVQRKPFNYYISASAVGAPLDWDMGPDPAPGPGQGAAGALSMSPRRPTTGAGQQGGGGGGGSDLGSSRPATAGGGPPGRLGLGDRISASPAPGGRVLKGLGGGALRHQLWMEGSAALTAAAAQAGRAQLWVHSVGRPLAEAGVWLSRIADAAPSAWPDADGGGGAGGGWGRPAAAAAQLSRGYLEGLRAGTGAVEADIELNERALQAEARAAEAAARAVAAAAAAAAPTGVAARVQTWRPRESGNATGATRRGGVRRGGAGGARRASTSSSESEAEEGVSDEPEEDPEEEAAEEEEVIPARRGVAGARLGLGSGPGPGLGPRPPAAPAPTQRPGAPVRKAAPAPAAAGRSGAAQSPPRARGGAAVAAAGRARAAPRGGRRASSATGGGASRGASGAEDNCEEDE